MLLHCKVFLKYRVDEVKSIDQCKSICCQKHFTKMSLQQVNLETTMLFKC